jgi:hypothetical protein
MRPHAQLKILDPVIRPITIAMMDLLMTRQWTT